MATECEITARPDFTTYMEWAAHHYSEDQFEEVSAIWDHINDEWREDPEWAADRSYVQWANSYYATRFPFQLTRPFPNGLTLVVGLGSYTMRNGVQMPSEDLLTDGHGRYAMYVGNKRVGNVLIGLHGVPARLLPRAEDGQ